MDREAWQGTVHGIAKSDVNEHAQIEYLVCMRAELLLTLCDAVKHSPPGSLAMGLCQQEHWSGLPFPPAGDLSNPGIKPASPEALALAGGFFIAEKPPGKP